MPRVSFNVKKYDGWFFKTVNDPTYWLIVGGKRKKIESQGDMHAHGLSPILTVSQKVLDGIPIKGAKEVKEDEVYRGEGDPVE